MDSRIGKLTVIASVSALVLIVLLVVGYNEITTKGQRSRYEGKEQVVSVAPVTDGQVGDDLSAFLSDDSFFDKEPEFHMVEPVEGRTALSLIVTSVQKDLRVRIVDGTGEPVAGESFYVQLDTGSEYKDLDRDGIVYIGDLAAGEVEVSLKPIKGYETPKEPVRVNVKEQVEYVPIDDILLLIKTEDEVNALLEDTETNLAALETTEPEISTMLETKPHTKAGIDVSKWQKEIDWKKVKLAGVDFAIIRAGYRGSSTGALVEDPYFRANMAGAKAAGIETGVYFFTQAVNEVEAVEEASMVVALLSEYDLEFPVFIDTEGAGGNGRADGLEKEMRTRVCDAFCRTVKNAGYEAGVYASRNWYENCLETKQLEDYVIWLAEYRETPKYTGRYEMWQYTSKGAIDGIEGNVDLNIRYY